MTRPTRYDIEIEIDALRAIKPRVLRRTFFGDDNHAAIDAQIDVLENNLDYGSICDNWEENDHVRDSALDARQWLDGEWDADEHEAGRPSQSWEELTR